MHCLARERRFNAAGEEEKEEMGKGKQAMFMCSDVWRRLEALHEKPDLNR